MKELQDRKRDKLTVQVQQKQALSQHDVSGVLPFTKVAKCGKCEILGDIAPCDECFKNGNDH